jgi:signal transduction histidine kinase
MASGEASLIIETPFQWLWLMWISIGIVSYLVVLVVGKKFIDHIEQSLTQALEPLQELKEAIRKMAASETVPVLTPAGIIELDEIQEAVVATQRELVTAREKIVKAKSKELAKHAYQRLIHDLHTPVAALSNFAIEAHEKPHDEALQEEARKKIPRLASQILAQLSAAAKNAEFEEPKFINEDLREAIGDARDQVSFVNGSIEIKSNLPDFPLVVAHDKVLMTRALTNLIKNAAEAGAKRVDVSVIESDGEIAILVEDDGPGMKPEELSLFLQGRGHSKKHDRFALGLSTVSHVARSHGGKIIGKTSKLGGACFEFRLKDNMRSQNKNREVGKNV